MSTVRPGARAARPLLGTTRASAANAITAAECRAGSGRAARAPRGRESSRGAIPLEPFERDGQAVARLGDRRLLLRHDVAGRQRPAKTAHELIEDGFDLQLGEAIADAHVGATAERNEHVGMAFVLGAAGREA